MKKQTKTSKVNERKNERKNERQTENSYLSNEADGLLRDKVLVLRVDELLPRAVAVPPHDAVEVRVELQLVLVQVIEQLICAQHLRFERDAWGGGGGAGGSAIFF